MDQRGLPHYPAFNFGIYRGRLEAQIAQYDNLVVLQILLTYANRSNNSTRRMEALQTAAQMDTNTGRNAILPATDAMSDNGRSSSLSDIGASESEEGPLLPEPTQAQTDQDSEAETERVEISPQKPQNRSSVAVSLARVEPGVDTLVEKTGPSQVEGNLLSGSDISSRSPSPTDPMSAGFEEALMGSPDQQNSPRKRKREIDDEDHHRRMRQRTRSTKSTSSHTSENEAEDIKKSLEDADDEQVGAEKEDDNSQSLPGMQQGKIVEQRNLKKSKRLNNLESHSGDELEETTEGQEEVEHASDEDEETGEAEEDVEAAAKSEEDAANQIAAMESLRDLEKQFAVLRDKLYDERISALQLELAQAKAPKPTHPDLQRQLRSVQQYRDQKKTNEVRLWEFKVESLRKTSAAQKSILDSSYFQKVRDIREHILELANESFCKIQNDRFRFEENTPKYWVPFSTQRGSQVAQQTAYNKEVSVLSGMAKHVGFPAAPEVVTARDAELDDDFSKMGISPTETQPTTKVQAPTVRKKRPTVFSESDAAAHEQWAATKPWANVHHPETQQILSRHGQLPPAQSSLPQNYVTPAAQKNAVDFHAPNGSASTLPENLSAPVSSAINTPRTVEREQVNGSDTATAKLLDEKNAPKEPSTTPAEATRRLSPPRSTPIVLNTGDRHVHHPSGQDGLGTAAGSPTISRNNLFHSPSRPDSNSRASTDHADFLSRHQTTSSPLAALHQPPREMGVTAASGFGRFGVR
ncbi:MAG: hypothetical protein Q9227_004209 [Pyrenula ochraceoflavens]